MGTTQAPRHVKIGGDYFRIDENSEVPFRRVADSMMAPRADISGVPGAVNLQRDVWSWTMSDFVGGEGRNVFDSSDPVGPPTFWKTEGGIDVRTRGEFSLHPDEQLVSNDTGGGSAPTVTTWTNTDLSTLAGSPTFSAGFSGDAVRLEPGESVQSPARTPGAGPVINVHCRFIQTITTNNNKRMDVQFRIRNTTDGVNTASATATLRDLEQVTLSLSFSPAAGKTYRYYAENVDAGSGGSVDVRRIREESFGTGPASPQDVRDLRLGVNEDVWALAWDGANTDVLIWNFSNDDWDQAVANMVASEPRALTGSDSYMYSLHANGEVFRITSAAATKYADDPAAAGFTGSYGEPLGLSVANNKIYALFQQGLFEITPDLNAGLPLVSSADYTIVAEPGEFFTEAAATLDLNQRQRMTAISGGVRFYVNVRGEQSVIYEYAGGTLTPTHFLPAGYIITAIKHYANITFIAAAFSNKASEPAEKRAALFFISADDLLRFLGYFRFTDTNSQPVVYICSYGHDVYFLQGRRIWRYNTGVGGLTMENEVSSAEETQVRALARMDKKFWVAVEEQGTFVADDSYPTQTMWMFSPLWDFDVPDLQKVLLGLDVLMRAQPANTHVTIEYSIDEGDWISAGVSTTTGTTKASFTVSTVNDTVEFNTLRYRVGLTSLDGVDTPRIMSVTARARVLDYESYFDMTLLAEDDTSTDRLISEHRTGRAKLQNIWQTAAAKQLITFEDHYSSSKFGDKDSYTVVIEDPFQDTTEKGQSSVRLKLKVLS